MTRQEVIPDELRRFILMQVPSVPYLEAVLLLRAEPQSHWDQARLARVLYLNEKNAALLMEQLTDNGVAARVQATATTPCCRYQPATPELAAMIASLAEIYARQLVAVTNLIHARSNQKAQRFADAFVWRKED